MKKKRDIPAFFTEDEMGDMPAMISVSDMPEMTERITIPEKVPILTLKNTVLFPGVTLPISVSTARSKVLLEDAERGDKIIAVVSQKDAEVSEPKKDDIYTRGVLAKVIRVFELPNGSTMAVIQANHKVDVLVAEEEPYLSGEAFYCNAETISDEANFENLVNGIREMSMNIISEAQLPQEASFALKNIKQSEQLLNFVCTNLNITVEGKQELLEMQDLTERADEALIILSEEYQSVIVRREIQDKVKEGIDEQQREYFLNQQLKTIQDELGGNPNQAEIENMKARAKGKKWSKEIAEVFNKEINRLSRTNPQMAEYHVQRNYLETLLDLPFGEYTKDNYNLKKASRTLDSDHFGLEKVKERILEHLAVLKLKGNMKSPIICLYGPPGVGKTSLGRSIAKSLNRQYIRMSLGGMRDEAEVKGHRKTYIGAMPGRIIQSIKRVKSSNPVFILDEIDKISRDSHGDPSSTMLEVLDPEQNFEFTDNYLDVPYDLSKVMFIATANSLSTIQPALRDRMEIIELTGYTVEEKIEIAKRHILPKQLEEHGLKKNHIKLSKKQWQFIIESYTAESGVRGLEKKTAKLVRQLVKRIAIDNKKVEKLDQNLIVEYLGHPIFEKDESESNEVAGVVTGLAWTQIGGDILMIESSFSKGNGKISMTGNLGDIMKESVQIAFNYIKSNAQKLGVKEELLSKNDFYIHVPQGAIPKDGPSAGITMLTSLISLLRQKRVKKDLAMTGEITLRGKVLPVGGIKEKILAAKRSGIKEIILCKKNRKDIEEIEDRYLKGLKFHFVDKMSEVLEIAITNQDVEDKKDLG
ncbi:MAG: endopeptidase La [Flavobacteriales bacterium]|jgi:ATP-dependent Lon protease|nr:endopeptidase La [Flavobacteriales bacterium]